ncbi:MAG: LytR C-terminal domain-containing protein [Chitinivibrionia bacterium]|nr:LytR C-terminal domain-containing protein [Chitinivibrionia bacterium]
MVCFGSTTTAKTARGVLNGVGTQGLAGRAADGLRNMGIDVFKVGNTNKIYAQSVLLARNSNPQIALLGEYLNCTNIIEQLQEEPLVDATLVLGEDYRALNLGLSADSGLRRP